MISPMEYEVICKECGYRLDGDMDFNMNHHIVSCAISIKPCAECMRRLEERIAFLEDENEAKGGD